MDKYEYQVCLQEIDSLILDQDYAGAADIADTIDWKRVKSVITLCKISDLYKINGRYEDARDLLLLAYDRNPSGRQIVSSLCTLELKLDHYVSALKYYNTFVQLAPRDPERYVLQYRLYQAQNVSLAEQTEVLETLKNADYRERWGYELAYLYYRQADYASAIRECDELAATFGDGQYVRKAMELRAAMTGTAPAEPAPYTEAYTEEQNEYPQDEAADVPEDTEDDTRVYNFAPGAAPVQDYLADRQVEKESAAVMAAAEEEEKEPEAEKAAAEEEAGPDISTQSLRDAVASGMASLEQTASAASAEAAAAAMPSDYGRRYEGRLSQEGSGQYEMVLETDKNPSRQITGQMYLYGMAGWEKTKNEIEQRFVNRTRQRISENTGSLLKEFEETSRQGYLEELEQDLDREEIEAAASSVIPDGMELSDGMTPQTRYRAALAKGAAPEGMAGDGYVQEEYPEEGYEEEYYEPAGEGWAYNEEGYDVYEGTGNVTADLPAQEQAKEALPSESPAAEKTAVEPEMPGPDAEPAAAAGEVKAEERPEEKEPDTKEDDPEATKSWSAHEIRTLEQEAALQTAVSASRRKQKEERLKQEQERRQAQEKIEKAEIDRQKAEIDRRMAELERERAELEREKAEQGRQLAKEREEFLKQIQEAQQASRTDKAEEESLDEEIRSAVEAEGRQHLEDSRPLGKIPAEAAAEAVQPEIPAEQEPVAEEPVIPEPVIPEPVMQEPEYVKEPEMIPEAVAEPVIQAEDVYEETVRGEMAEAERLEEEKREERRRRAEAARRNYSPREIREDEKAMFSSFIGDSRTSGQITYALDNMTLAAYTGNILIAGSSRESSMNLAKAFIRYLRSNESGFSGKVAHSTGEVINRKDLIKALHSIENGALIVEGAGAMSTESLRDMAAGLDREDKGLLVILIDSAKKISQIMERAPELEDAFNIRVDLVPMNNDALVADAVRYAEASGYTIDDFGVLALHTRISGMQTIDHTVTVDEVRKMVDEAISYADKKTPGRLMGRMFGKRYDDNKRVILREKDFQHYN